MSGDSPWTYTFYDIRSREELAVLPLTGVNYTRPIQGAGQLNAVLDLASEKVRALNPWRATKGRRTVLYVEYEDQVVWGGPVSLRSRSDADTKMAITGVTWEGWLHRQRLTANIAEQQQPLPTALRLLVLNAQLLTNVGIDQPADYMSGGSYVFGPAWNEKVWVGPYSMYDVKPVLELMDQLPIDTERGIEWRIRPYRDPLTGRIEIPLVMGMPTLGRRFEDSKLTFAWPTGSLLHWKLLEDGSGADNYLTLLGAGSGPTQPFEIIRDADAGLDEIASGYPSWGRDYRSQDIDDEQQLRRRGFAEMRAGLAGEYLFTDVEVDALAYIGKVDPGDDIGLEIVSPVLEEYPDAVTTITRVLGEAVTVGDGGAGDTVKLTVGGVAA